MWPVVEVVFRYESKPTVAITEGRSSMLTQQAFLLKVLGLTRLAPEMHQAGSGSSARP